MFKKIFDRHKLEISLICAGDTGQDIGGKMIQALKKHGAQIKSLAITSELEQHHDKQIFNVRVLIDNQHDGFAKKLEEGINAAEKHRTQIDDAIQKILPEDKEGLMLVITGAGATGLGSTLISLDILYKKYRKVPPIVTLLPEIFESSRVQYNISTFLYRTAFRQDHYGNAILLLDNKPTQREMQTPFSKVSNSRLETIPAAFADLLYGSFEKAVSSEFDGSVQDLFEVMHTSGIAVFISEELSTDEDEVDRSRISDIVEESVISTTSLSKEQVFDAKNAFLTLFNITMTRSTDFEARKLQRSFRDTHPFIKIVVPDEKAYGNEPKLRGIVAGLPLPNRILQIMRMARESRKRIIIKEHNMSKEVIPLDIEKVESLEDQLKIG